MKNTKLLFTIASFLIASLAHANVVISGTALQGATGVADGDTGFFIVATDADSFGSISFNQDADLSLGSSYLGGDFEVIGSSVAFTSFGSVRMGTGYDFALAGGISVDDPFAYVVFGESSSTANAGDTYNIFTSGNWVLPSDGSTITANTEYTQITGAPSFSGTVVPEPSTYAALSGCLALAWVMLRRRRA